MTQQTDRDLKAELDSLDSYETAPTDFAWPQSAPENSAVKALDVEDTIAREVEETRKGVAQEAEKSFFSNLFDNVVSTVRDYRGPLADDFEKNMPGGLPIPGGLEGLDLIARKTTGVAPTDAITGNVDEMTKGTNRGFYNTMSSFAGGVEQYGKTLGSETITGYAGERKEAFKGKAEKPYFKPRIEGLKDISKETWFSDAVDYAISGVGEGLGSSAPFLAVGAVTGLPGAMAFGYTSSVGELRDELISNGVTDEATVQKYAYIAAVPHAMLDQLTERGVLKSLTEDARKEATKGIVRLVLNGAVKGAAKEGVTEAAQRVIELGAVAHAKGGEAPNAAVVAAIFADVEKGVESTILESGVKGALPGTVFGVGEVAGQQMQPVQEARVRTPNTATDATPVAPEDARAVAPMMEGPAQKGMPGATSEPATFSEPELEAARKAIQDAAQGLPVEVIPEGQPPEEQPRAVTADPETAPLTQEDADAAVQEVDAAISDEDLDIPAVFAEVEDYLAENEIQVDDIADEAVREIAQAVYNGEDLGVAVDRALGLEETAPAVDPDRQRRLDARAAATDSAPLDATQIGTDFRNRAQAKFETMPERDRDTSGETPEQARARRLENRAGATGSRTIQDPAAVRQKFAEVLASTTPRSQWAEASGVDPETLNTLIDEAVADGRMEIRFGKPVRKAAARVAPVKPQRPAAPASAPALLRTEEKRLEAVKSDKAYTAAADLFNARGTPESFQAALDRLYSDKAVKNADLAQVVKAFTGKRKKPKNRQDAIAALKTAYTAWAARNSKGKPKNAAERADVGQGPGVVPEGRVSGEVRPDAEGRDAEATPGDGGAGRAGDVGGREGQADDGAGPAGGVRGQGQEAGADPGDRAGTGEPRADTQPDVAPPAPRERTAEEIAALEADLAAELEEAEAQRRDRLSRNYRITDADRIGQGGPKQKVRANIAAIETLKKIEEEGRPATDEEKAILVKYVGWGAFSQPIFRDYNQDFAKERAALKTLLTPEEYKSARDSTINAHFTSPEVIKGMWSALEHMGFKGGRVLEPSVGVGHFIGLQPEAMAGNSSWTAVDLDTLSGRITKALYGAADVRIGGYEEQIWPNDHFDLAISNVPFAAEGPYDPAYKQKFTLHDYFFVKSLDKVRPGGIVAFITSSGTLDKTRDQAQREMEKRGTFLGAIRLPGGNKGAFKANAGTDVTTDIIFFRKKMQGEPIDINAEWTDLETVKTPEGDTEINRYFVANPDMMLGKMRLIGSMYGKGEPVLIGPTDDMELRIAQAAKALPENAMTERSTVVAPVDEVDTATDGIKEGAFYEKDGKIFRKVVGVGQPQKLNKQDAARVRAFIPMRDTINEMLAKQARGDKMGMEDLRAALSASYDAFVKEFGPVNLTNVTTQTRKNGKVVTIKRMPNFAVLEDDMDAYKVAAIESYDVKTGKAIKTAIFTEDLLKPYERPAITGPADALTVSLNEAGRVDMKLIANVLGVSEKRAAQELGDSVFLNPTGEQWQTATQYLSGDVVTKMADAKAAAALDAKYTRNVAALEAVQPIPLTRNEITIPFGASYVPEDVINAFLAETLEARGVQATLNPATKSWSVRFTGGLSDAARAQWATPDVKVGEIVEAALNSKPIQVYRNVDKDTRVRDPAAEELARAKVTMLKEAFTGQIYPGAQAAVGGWVWNDEARATRLEAVYNNAMNRLVKEQHDGSHLTFPGLARVVSFPDGTTGKINLPPARTGAIWRIIQNGNTLIDHVVGAGKTWTSIMAVQEMKRLGQIRRPMFVVPNHMLMQFSAEFLQAYPGAKLLVATKDSMSKAKRAEFAAKAAAEKWDGIIITHSAFSRLKMQDAAYKDYYEEILSQMESAKKGEDDATVKDIVKAQKRIKTKLDNLIKKESKDQGVTFEELGVDHITVDEAHLFKNLWFMTRHTRVKGISNSSESQRATDLYIKIRHLEKSRPGRSALFLTGTPLSNTMAEVYTMMRYLQRPTLEEYDIAEFDSWAQTFGMIDTKSELASNSRDYTDITSFSKFVNIPELSTLYGRIADTQTAESLGLERPAIKGGMPQVVMSEPSAQERSLLDTIITEMEKLKGAKPVKGAPNFLSMFTKGLQASTDARLVDPSAPYNPDGKIGKAVDNIFRIWEEGNKDPAKPDKGQIVFLDMGVPGSRATAKPMKAGTVVDENAIDVDPLEAVRKGLADTGETVDETEDGEELQPEANEDDAAVESMMAGKFNLYEDIKGHLIAKGMPADQIAFIHDAKNDDQKAKMFEAVREGKIRVLIGSTGKMGVGTNVQKRLIALHHIDAPWRPSDLEQRDGRILRQGNKNPEIQIYRYITTKSFEAYRWQILERKASFIAQFRAGARGLRIAEDIDSPLPDASEIKAAATGDSRIIEYAELERTVRGLIAQASAHSGVAGRARQGLERAKANIARIKNHFGTLERDAAKVVDLKGDAFKITANLPGGKTQDITERKKAGQALGRYVMALAQNAYYGREIDIEFGQISGFELAGTVKKGPDGIEVRPEIRGDETYRARSSLFFTEDTNPVTLMQYWERLVSGVPELLADAKSRLASEEAQIPALEAKTVSTPFPKQAELEEKQKRLVELGEALKPKAKKEGDLPVKGDIVRVEELQDQDWRKLKADIKLAQPFSTVDQMLELAAVAHEKLTALGKKIGAALGITYKAPKLKGRARIVEKLNGDDPRLITDAARGGFEVETVEQSDRIVDELAKELGVVDEGWTVTPAGYFDRKIMVRFENGIAGEVQVWPPGMYRVKKEKGQALYTEARRPTTSPEDRERLNAQQRELYAAVVKDMAMDFQELAANKASAASMSKSGNLAASSSRESMGASRSGARMMGAADPTSTLPVSEDRNTALSSVATAGASSQSKYPNFMGKSSEKDIGGTGENVQSNAQSVAPVSVKDFAQSVADLKDRLSKEKPRSPLIQDDVVDIEEVSLSIREFLPAVAEPVEGGRLPKVQEATQTFVAGLTDVVTVARQQEAVDTTNATYDDLDVFTDALDDLDGIIEDKLQEGYEVDDELSTYESSLIDAIDEIESEYETISSDAETEIGYLNEIMEDIAERLPAEPEDDGTETTAVSTDVKRVMDDLPEWTPSKNLIDEARKEIAWLKEKWQPIYDRGNAVWGVDTDEMTEAELVAYANEVDDVRSEMTRFKWHADFMVKQVAEKGRPGIETALDSLRNDVLKPTMDELDALRDSLQARRNAEVDRMNAMLDEDGETAIDPGEAQFSLAGLYHGSLSDIQYDAQGRLLINPDVFGSRTKSGEKAFFLSPNVELASRYAAGDGGRVYRAVVETENFQIVDGGNWRNEPERVRAIIEKARAAGKDGVLFRGMQDGTGIVGDQYAVINPAAMRAFDDSLFSGRKSGLRTGNTYADTALDEANDDPAEAIAYLERRKAQEKSVRRSVWTKQDAARYDDAIAAVKALAPETATGGKSRLLSLFGMASLAGDMAPQDGAALADGAGQARMFGMGARLRPHARALFAAGLDQDALNKAITAMEKDRALAPQDRAAIAESYVGGYVDPKAPSREIRKVFAERVHDVSLAELGGFDPSVSGSNLDWRPEARAALSEMAARLPEGTGFTVRNFIEIATRSASMRKVGLEIEGGIFTPDAAERQLGMDPKSAKKIMAISLAYGPDVALQTFTHEEIHAVRELLTDKEWGVLSKLATRKPKKSEALRLIDIVETNGKVTPQHAEFLRANAGSLTYREIYGIDQRYGRLNLTEDKLVEEVVAHAAADWADGHDFGTRIERVMMKIRDLIEALGNLLKGQGFETVDSVFNSIWSGEVAKRAAVEDGQAMFSLAGKQPLDMSPEARKARAEAMGFDTKQPVYRGMDVAPDGNKYRTSDGSLGQGVYVSPTRTHAAKFGNAVEELYLRGNYANMADVPADVVSRPLYRDMLGLDGTAGRRAAEWARANGYDGLIQPSYQTVVFDPANIRSVNAAFDPAEEGSGLLMASLSGDQSGTDVAQLNQAIDSLKNALGIQITQNLFGVTIKAGKRKVRINPRSNILGQTSRTTGGVGVRRSRDIKAIAHEGGHSLELMLGSSLANLKAKFADALTTPFAPDVPMPKNLRPTGFSGLELDDVEQKALVEAVTTKAALMDMTKQVGTIKAAPRMIGRATYDEAAYRKVENAAGAARANLIRLVGKTRADALVDQVERSTPPDVPTFVQERFSPMGAPKRRVTTAPSGEALSEAFARWFEKYTMSRESAFDMAPGFFDAFEDLLEAEAPSVLEGMHTVQEQYKAWTKRATVEDLSSDVVSVAAKNTWSDIREGKKGFSDKITGWTAEAYTGVIDDLSPVQQIVRRLLAVADRNGVKDDQGRPISLKVSENPYKIARMFRGSYATGYTWIKDGIPNHGEEKVIYPGLQKAMEAIFGNDTYDEPTYRAFGQYLISKRAIAEYDRLAAKKGRLAALESSLDQGGKVLSNMNYDQALDAAKLERRTTRHVRLDTIRRDRMNALRRAKTEERDVQERIQEIRDDLAEALRAIDDGSDVARATRDRRRRGLQMAERNARDVRNKIVDMEQELDELNMEWTFLGNEIVNLRKATEDRAPQIAAIEKSIALLKREQDATSKRGASRPPTLEAKEWHEEFLAKVARDKKFAKFEEAAQIVYGFTQGLLTIRYQAGLIPEKLYQELSSRKGWYVPFMRDMSDAPAESVFTGGGVKAWSPFKKFDGSDRAIINPLEILSQESYAAAQHIALNEAVGALAALAQKAGPGSANIAEMMQRTEDLENNPETFTRIRDIAISMGIDEADATLMAQRMETNFANEDLQAIWSPGSKGPVAEPTLPLWQNGERKHVVLRDPEFAQDALEAMRGMGKEEMGWIAELFGKPARLLQLGVTTHPTFMPRNLVRDVFDAWIKTGALPIVTQIKGARELYRKDGEFLRQYTAAGGILGGRNIAALTSKEQQADVMDMDPRKIRHGSAALGAAALGITGSIMGGPLGLIAGGVIGYAGARHGGLLKMVEAIESMTRLGVAAHAYDRAKIHNPNLTEQEAMLEAAFVARDVFDWNRRGSKTLALVRMITFLNAQIQGLDRAARAVGGAGDRGSAVAKQMAAVFRREHDIPLSADEQRDLGEAYKTWARLGLYTALLLSLYAMYRDDDRYEDIKDGTKATHSWLPGFLGVDVRIPKAFEWAMPANFIEILWDKMEGRDPNVGERWRKSAQEVLVPPGTPQALNLLSGWTMNTDLQSIAPWLFGESADVVNRKIVSDELKKLAPEAQFDAFTSQLSKDIALAMAKAGLPEAAIPSPKMIDFTLRTGGYWGQDVQKGYQVAKEGFGFPAGPQPRVPDWPVIGGFTGVAARQSKSTEMLYRLMSQQGGDFTTAAYTYKNLMDKSGNPAEAESFLNRLEPEARAYAILNYNFTAADKRRHPLERASAMAKISRDIRKEIVLDRLAPQVKEGRKTVYDFDNKIDLPPAVKTQVTEIMERLAQAESWNGFVVLGRPGWEGKNIIATQPILAELKAAAPDVYELYEGRVEKAKIQDFEEIQRDWPKMREELLRNGADANF